MRQAIEVSTRLRHSGNLTLRAYNLQGRLIGKRSDRVEEGENLSRIVVGEIAQQELFVVVERDGVEYVVKVGG